MTFTQQAALALVMDYHGEARHASLSGQIMLAVLLSDDRDRALSRAGLPAFGNLRAAYERTLAAQNAA